MRDAAMARIDPPEPLTMIAASAAAHAAIGEHVYDFYRCYSCKRLITQPEMMAVLHEGRICPCGGLKVSPVGPNIGMRWYDWLRPRVLVFTYARWRGRA